MWKAAIFSTARAHKILAVILVSVAAVSTTVLVYRNTIFAGFRAGFQGTWCPPNTIAFQNNTTPPWTVYQVYPPGRITICFTGQIRGPLPVEGLTLVPNVVLRNSNGFSSCNYGAANCGGVNDSASPARIFRSPATFHVVATIDVPVGSTHGVYWVFFAPGCTGAVLSLRIGEQDQTPQATSGPALACPIPTYEIGVIFNSYMGMIPVSQNGTIPALF